MVYRNPLGVMAMKKYIATLTEDERKALSDLTVKGKQNHRRSSMH